MMGSKERTLSPLVSVSLEGLVPADDFYRHLDRALDLSFVRDLVREYYREAGRPSIDPVVFFKLQLIMFFEGIRSERQLMRVVADRLSLRWYLGYDLTEALPDHSSLSRIRERYGVEIFQRFFEHIVDLCQQAGLVWGKELIFDATQVRANADADSLVPRFYLRAKAHVAALFTPETTEVEAATATASPSGPTEPVESASEPDQRAPSPGPLPTGLTREEDEHLAEENRAIWKLLEQRRLDPERPPSGPYQRLIDRRVSTTDPDAALMRLKGGGMRLGYQDHYVVDGGKARIILAALVTPADVMENTPMLDLLQRVRFRWKLRPQRAIGDAAYGTAENIRLLEEAGIRAYVPLVEYDKSSPFFRQQDFTYNADRDVYTCPGGTLLRFRGNNYVTQVRIYQAPTEACQACPIRSQCTDSTEGRKLNRHFDEEYRERVRGYHTTAAYQKAMRKRQVWVEPLFGEAKDWHGLRRFRLRGLEKVNCEGLLVAAGQNLKRLLRKWGWGRRPWPTGGVGWSCWPCPAPATALIQP
jgi:transposase